jgi:hypothetical protein
MRSPDFRLPEATHAAAGLLCQGKCPVAKLEITSNGGLASLSSTLLDARRRLPRAAIVIFGRCLLLRPELGQTEVPGKLGGSISGPQLAVSFPSLRRAPIINYALYAASLCQEVYDMQAKRNVPKPRNLIVHMFPRVRREISAAALRKMCLRLGSAPLQLVVPKMELLRAPPELECRENLLGKL